MAAPLNKRQTESHRASIDCAKLIKRLQNHAHMEVDYTESGFAKPPTGFMTPSQISAAKILLDKALSNAPTEIDANVTGNIQFILSKDDVDI